MLKPQRDNYNMFLTVEGYFNKHPEAWNTNEPVTQAKTDLSNLLKQLSVQLGIQLENSTGITEEKRKLRKQLEQQAYIISSGASAYALRTSNFDFYAKIYFSKSYFFLLRDAELQSVCTNLVKDCAVEIENLLTYGITPALLVTLTDNTTAFANLMRAPKESIRKRMSATKAIAVLTTKIATLLTKEMDSLMVGLSTTAPEFVSVYKNIRRLKKAGKTKLSLTTTVVDAILHTPIEEAHLRVIGTKIKRKSSTKGYNTIKNLPEGKYEISVSHSNYNSIVLPFTVVQGVTTKLVLALQPLGTFAKGLKPINKRKRKE